jgi:hypothetical protein
LYLRLQLAGVRQLALARARRGRAVLHQPRLRARRLVLRPLLCGRGCDAVTSACVWRRTARRCWWRGHKSAHRRLLALAAAPLLPHDGGVRRRRRCCVSRRRSSVGCVGGGAAGGNKATH